jgi:hypothetical protein
VESWKPVTLPTAWHGRFGHDGSGIVGVAPRVTVVLSTWAAPAIEATAIAATAAAASAMPTRRPLREIAVKARREVLGMGTAPLWKRRLSREL